MGRAFEFRKERKFKRWDKMAKMFTRLGKEIAMAVKANGPNPESNSRLRTAIQNAKGINMPKQSIENAIKKASAKDDKGFLELVYEGYGPHGIAIIVETATDNTNRTVANMRTIFNKNNGVLGNSGSVEFMFERKAIFKINPAGVDFEELELELIDAGLEDIIMGEDGTAYLYAAFTDFGNLQKALETLKVDVVTAEFERIPANKIALTEAQEEEVMDLIEKLNEDDDVQNVFHSMA